MTRRDALLLPSLLAVFAFPGSSCLHKNLPLDVEVEERGDSDELCLCDIIEKDSPFESAEGTEKVSEKGESRVPAILLLSTRSVGGWAGADIQNAWQNAAERDLLFPAGKRDDRRSLKTILKQTIDNEIEREGGWCKEVGRNYVVCLGHPGTDPPLPLPTDQNFYASCLLSEDLFDSIRLVEAVLGPRIELTANHPVMRPSRISCHSWSNMNGTWWSTMADEPLVLHLGGRLRSQELLLSRVAAFHSCTLEVHGARFRFTDISASQVRESLANAIAECGPESGPCDIPALSSEVAPELIPYLRQESPAVVLEVLASLYATELRESKGVVGNDELRRLTNINWETVQQDPYSWLDIQHLALAMLVSRGQAEDLARVEAVARQAAARQNGLKFLGHFRRALKPDWDGLDLTIMAAGFSERASECQDSVIQAFRVAQPALALRRVKIGQLPVQVSEEEIDIIVRRSVNFLNNVMRVPAGREAIGQLCFSEDGLQALLRVVIDCSYFDFAYRAQAYEVRLKRQQGAWLVAACTQADIIS